MNVDLCTFGTAILPVVPFEGNHPAMLIAAPDRDIRFDVITQSEFTQNNETYD